ncbi:MAG TPA: HAD-IIIC family phosphatase [Planctomycetes bacterium]|nr:HAD-IIIC family phosphatase [Planctomycetota bacterium]HIN79941.1 HAD-IIIC family phosphatase [Planctomycetota bacterium]
MHFKLFVFDLDETLWSVEQSSLDPIRGPFTLIDSHEAVGTTGTVCLHAGVRSLLRAISLRSSLASLASRNERAVCEELLGLFGIQDHFVFPQYGWEEKGQAVLNIIRALSEFDGIEISAPDVLFIDDWPANTEAVQKIGASTLLFGRDLRSIQELATLIG